MDMDPDDKPSTEDAEEETSAAIEMDSDDKPSTEDAEEEMSAAIEMDPDDKPSTEDAEEEMSAAIEMNPDDKPSTKDAEEEMSAAIEMDPDDKPSTEDAEEETSAAIEMDSEDKPTEDAEEEMSAAIEMDSEDKPTEDAEEEMSAAIEMDSEDKPTEDAEEEMSTHSIETVDIKLEPPDATIALRIESIESREYDPNDSQAGFECGMQDAVIKQELEPCEMLAPEVSLSYDDSGPGQMDEQPNASCLQEELVLKEECEDIGFEAEVSKNEILGDAEIKTESSADITVTIDRIREHDHLIESHQSPQLMDNSAVFSPQVNQMTELPTVDSVFQLNSITGDMLSLEQEAYGLLKAKNKQKIISTGTAVTCPKCPKVCRDNAALSKHLNVHDAIDRRADGVKRAVKTRAINKHKRNVEAKTPNADDYKDEGKPKGLFQCDNCSKKYKSARSLRRHKKICLSRPAPVVKKKSKKERVDTELETNESMQVTNESDKTIPVTNNINRMAIRKGEIIKQVKNGQYTCECGKTFSRRSPLETCLRSHHPEEESEVFTCVTCAKQFLTKDQLVRHRKFQHVKKKFHCKFCPMDYQMQKELLDHLKVHRKVQMMEYKVISEVVEGKQVLKCFICKMTFSELSELKMHVSIDHKEPYSCPHCKEKFQKIVDFATHTKSAHPEIEGKSVLDVLEAFSILAQAWKCEECHLQFKDPDNLVKHQREEHSPSKKQTEEDSSKFLFRCEDCRRMFATLKQLTTHKTLHHVIQNGPEEIEKETAPQEMRPPLPMCVHCRKVCKDEVTLTSHLRLHSTDRKYPCKFCDYRFATFEKRRNHIAIHTGDMKFVCFICEYRCTSENRLNFHKQTQKHIDFKTALLNGPPYEIIEPPPPPPVAKKKRLSSERKKSQSCDEQVPCDICGEMFENQRTMLEHKDTHPFIVFPNEDEPKTIFFK